MVVENSDHVGISLLSPSNRYGYLGFGIPRVGFQVIGDSTRTGAFLREPDSIRFPFLRSVASLVHGADFSVLLMVRNVGERLLANPRKPPQLSSDSRIGNDPVAPDATRECLDGNGRQHGIRILATPNLTVGIEDE